MQLVQARLRYHAISIFRATPLSLARRWHLWAALACPRMWPRSSLSWLRMPLPILQARSSTWMVVLRLAWGCGGTRETPRASDAVSRLIGRPLCCTTSVDGKDVEKVLL